MTLETWLVYLLAVTGLSLTPGPNGLLALSHGALYGYRKTLFTVSGGALGFILVIALSMVGIGTLLQTSAYALVALKWCGGAYLIWLGYQLWRAPAMELKPLQQAGAASGLMLFRQGLLAAISNPKVLLFFGAFLPQFLEPGRSLLEQFLWLALTFAVVEFVVEYLLARLAYQLRPWLERTGRKFNRCCGGMFALIGIALPLSR